MQGQQESKLHLRSTLIPSTAVRSQCKATPRVYDTSPKSQLLCIDIRTASYVDSPFDATCGTLHVSPHDLLDLLSTRYGPSHIDTPGFLLVPWQAWAGLASWVDTRHFRMNNERYMFGQRTVSFSVEPSLPGQGYNAIAVMDFDQRRLRARRAMGAEGVCVPQVSDMWEDNRVYGNNRGQAFFEGENTAERGYAKTIYGMRHNNHSRHNSIMMDDERGEYIVLLSRTA